MSEKEQKLENNFDERLEKIESNLLEQDHRLFRVLINFFVVRPKLEKDDPKRDAITRSLIWRVFSARTAATIGFSFLGILGAYLAIKANDLLDTQNQKIQFQNELIQHQNDKIDIQNHLTESNRRAALIFELTSINEEISRLSRDRNDQIKLPQYLIGRIISLSRSFRPYRYIDYDQDSGETHILSLDKKLSPERGQLLINLINANISNLHEFGRSIEFSYADVSNTNLEKMDFSRLILRNVNFKGSDLSFSSFNGADLTGAVFNKANLSHASFIDWSQKEGEETSFMRIELESAEFIETDLEGVTFNSHQDFSSLSLDGANVSGANINDSILYSESTQNVFVCFLITIVEDREEIKRCENWLENLPHNDDGFFTGTANVSDFLKTDWEIKRVNNVNEVNSKLLMDYYGGDDGTVESIINIYYLKKIANKQ